MKKDYILDTNVLIDAPNCIEILINGNENNIHIPKIVIDEIDTHKSKTLRLKPQIREIINNLNKLKEHISLFGAIDNSIGPDDNIIKDITNNELFKTGILVTNDRLLQFKADKAGIKWEDYKSSKPFKSESEIYTGFIDINTEEMVENCFFYDKGKLCHYKNCEVMTADYEASVWKVKPITKWQNACMMLLLDDSIPLVSIQSQAGAGKTFIALAAALQLVLEEKKYKRIYIVKPNIEIGTEMGFLPGGVGDKMDPFFRPVIRLLTKLHDIRPANRIFNPDMSLNSNIIELMPINFLRGWDMEDCVVVIDETQNVARAELRTILTRMGNNVKCICTGDVQQIDNKYNNNFSNGINWLIKKFKGEKGYAHIVLGGTLSRGPIASMTIRKEL